MLISDHINYAGMNPLILEQNKVEGNGILDLINTFAGGAFNMASIFALATTAIVPVIGVTDMHSNSEIISFNRDGQPTTLGLGKMRKLLAYARDQNVTQIIAGKARRSPIFEAIFGSVVRQLIDRSGSIPIEVVPEPALSAKSRFPLAAAWPALTSRGVAEALTMTLLASLVAWPLDVWLDVSNLTLVYLAAVLISALTRGLWAGLITGFASALAFNWLYTEPRYTLSIADPDNVLALLAFSGAALVVSALAGRARQQTLSARTEARTSRELFGLSRQLTSAATEDEAAESLARYAGRAFDVECVVLARVGLSDLRLAGASATTLDLTDADMAAARWTAEKGEPTGRGADTLPGA
ncbi:MAG: DUF4118 domain-containing protein, partial [Burkholderiales bacterium]